MPDGDTVAGLNLPVVAVEGGQEGVGGPQAEAEDTREKVEGGVEQTRAAGEPPKKKDSQPKPFLLSEGLPPVPVGRILKGEFIDMAELLRDNLEAERRGVLQDASSSSSSSSQGCSRREVPDLLSWVQCFAAVVASEYPERVLKLLAYQVREARRCGGWGWLTYDTVFCQQMAREWRGEEWGRLNPYPFSSTFFTLGKEDCALAKGKGVGSARHPRPCKGSVSQGGIRAASGNGLFRMESRRVLLSVLPVQARVRCWGDHRITACRVGSTQEKRPARDKESKGPSETPHL
jgi:hypothetical protein